MIILQNSFFSYGNIYGNRPIFIDINYDDKRKSFNIIMDFASTCSLTNYALATYYILATRVEDVIITHTLLMVLLMPYYKPIHKKSAHQSICTFLYYDLFLIHVIISSSLLCLCFGLPERLSSWFSPWKITIFESTPKYLSAVNICTPCSRGHLKSSSE